ncbi:sigma-54-dependent transcriptional regulator [Halocola ammonii]
MKKVLIIDDDVDICMLLNRYLSKNGFHVEEAFRGENGLKMLVKEKFDVVLCDFRLPDFNGLDLIKEIRKHRPETQVIVITGYSDVKVAVKTLKSGAFDYVTKPIQPEEILLTIKSAMEMSPGATAAPAASGKSGASKKKSGKSGGKGQTDSKRQKYGEYYYVKGTSSKATQIHQSIELIAPTDMSVIILGETGTGKEVAARTIHAKSKRSDKPFVAIDCGALPKELAGSELFGHVKGAFTGAVQDKPGSFELANGGTLFLDEIGNLSYENQIKLLRVLQERVIKKVGGTKDIEIDVRVLVATNENLKNAVSGGTFREDLFYRLNEFRIELPPLRERKSDLMDFAHYFLELANAALDKEVEGFDDKVVEKMQNYYWHGNLRELKNVVKRATLLSSGDEIDLTCLPDEIIHPSFIAFKNDESEDEITDLKSVAERAEKRAILEVLKKTGYNKTKTAEILKVDRKTLYNKINAYDIDLG